MRTAVGLTAALAVALGVAVPAVAVAQDSGTISGTRFMDRNGDGIRQHGEYGVQWYPVYLETPSGEKVGSAEIVEDGTYLMEGVAPGDYVLVFPPAHGKYLETTPRRVPVRVEAGGTHVVNTGIQGGEIAGIAWQDLNDDGQRQQDEPPMAGVRVHVPSVAETRTAEDGSYHLYDLPVNLINYPVGFEVRPGMVFSRPLVGDDTTDSDVGDADSGFAQADISIYKGMLLNDLHIGAGYVRQTQ